MISEKLESAFNKQLNEELRSAYLYMSMSAWFETRNFTGMAHWMSTQAKEEYEHAMKFYKHIIERGGKVRLGSIESPKNEWSSPLNAFEDAYKHECYITGCINNLYTLAEEEKDRPAQVFLNWFVDEQVEEEANTDSIVQKMKMVKDSANGLFMIDKGLSKRGE